MDQREMSEMFGEVISSFTRKQAHDDGFLIDVSSLDGASIYKYPVSITTALHEVLIKGAGKDPEVYSGRVWDVCFMCTTAQSEDGGSDVFFKCIVGSRTLDLWGNCGPSDDGSPCMTFGFPEDR